MGQCLDRPLQGSPVEADLPYVERPDAHLYTLLSPDSWSKSRGSCSGDSTIPYRDASLRDSFFFAPESKSRPVLSKIARATIRAYLWSPWGSPEDLMTRWASTESFDARS